MVVGPTSSGKSALAVELARRFNGEVISADSRQVYRGLNLGSGKITRVEMKGIKHYMLDVASGRRRFSAGNFVARASRALENILTQHRIPIICGGTGFYIDALLGTILLPEVEPNTALREQLAQKTTPALVALLKKLAPRRANNIDLHNRVRLIRAIEIAKALGRIPTLRPGKPMYTTLTIGLYPGEKVLIKKITERLRVRLRQGMVAEARRLHAAGLSWKRMEELGLEYRHLARLLQHKVSRAEFEEGLLRDIRNYSKRQMRWWKRDPQIHWFTSGANKTIFTTAKKFLAE